MKDFVEFCKDWITDTFTAVCVVAILGVIIWNYDKAVPVLFAIAGVLIAIAIVVYIFLKKTDRRIPEPPLEIFEEEEGISGLGLVKGACCFGIVGFIFLHDIDALFTISLDDAFQMVFIAFAAILGFCFVFDYIVHLVNNRKEINSGLRR